MSKVTFRGLTIAAILATATATPSLATTFAGDYTVSANTGDGLIINTTKDANLTSGFTLSSVGQTKVYNDFFTISTPESTVNWTPTDDDDIIPRPISVAFNFTSPSSVSGSIDGDTVGEAFLLGAYQDGRLTWDNGGTTILDFGSAGRLQISLENNVVFGDAGIFPDFGLTSKSAQVGATFKLLSPGAVPEPASWALMIAGFGLVGGAMRYRGGKRAVSFA